MAAHTMMRLGGMLAVRPASLRNTRIVHYRLPAPALLRQQVSREGVHVIWHKQILSPHAGLVQAAFASRMPMFVNAVAVGDKVGSLAPACHAIPGSIDLPRFLQLPSEVKFNYFDAEGNMQEISVEELTKGKKVQLQQSGCMLSVTSSALSILKQCSAPFGGELQQLCTLTAPSIVSLRAAPMLAFILHTCCPLS